VALYFIVTIVRYIILYICKDWLSYFLSSNKYMKLKIQRITTTNKIISHSKAYLIPKWKRAVISWIGIFPLITFLVYLIGTWTANLPFFVDTLIITSISVPLMTYVITPTIEHILKNWFFRCLARH
ncbi:MAG: hypothetical protein M3162_03670, partial [Thermoproteota archaeon]|nr:hypothetical protein [Thermoproteota archaeon]